MNLLKNLKKQQKKGFSFIEIVVSLVVIIALTVGAFFVYNEVQHPRKMAQMTRDMDAIVTGCLTYESLNINSQPPTSLSKLTTGLSQSESIDGLEHKNIVRSTKAPDGNFVDPWGQAYEYDQATRSITCVPKDKSGAAMNPVVRYF